MKDYFIKKILSSLEEKEIVEIKIRKFYFLFQIQISKEKIRRSYQDILK
jgi:hypothetical protein